MRGMKFDVVEIFCAAVPNFYVLDLSDYKRK